MNGWKEERILINRKQTQPFGKITDWKPDAVTKKKLLRVTNSRCPSSMADQIHIAVSKVVGNWTSVFKTIELTGIKTF